MKNIVISEMGTELPKTQESSGETDSNSEDSNSEVSFLVRPLSSRKTTSLAMSRPNTSIVIKIIPYYL